jgi:phospholipase C
MSAPLTVPGTQAMPGQEKGVRPARALPYALEAVGQSAGSTWRIDFNNLGGHAAVFHARSTNPSDLPRCYTVGANQSLRGLWSLSANNTYDVSVYGPNGFFRSFKGRVSAVNASLRVRCEASDERVTLKVTNQSGRRVTVRVLNRYENKTYDQLLDRGETMSKSWNLHPFYGWYEYFVTVLEDNTLAYRLAGHLENGKDSFSDPLMGGLV